MRRTLHIKLNLDRHYPRFSGKYFRKRWSWETMLSNEGERNPFAVYEGNAPFAIIALAMAYFPRVFGKARNIKKSLS